MRITETKPGYRHVKTSVPSYVKDLWVEFTASKYLEVQFKPQVDGLITTTGVNIHMGNEVMYSSRGARRYLANLNGDVCHICGEPMNMSMRNTTNRGDAPTIDHILPFTWFKNGVLVPQLREIATTPNFRGLIVDDMCNFAVSHFECNENRGNDFNSVAKTSLPASSFVLVLDELLQSYNPKAGVATDIRLGYLRTFRSLGWLSAESMSILDIIERLVGYDRYLGVWALTHFKGTRRLRHLLISEKSVADVLTALNRKGGISWLFSANDVEFSPGLLAGVFGNDSSVRGIYTGAFQPDNRRLRSVSGV